MVFARQVSPLPSLACLSDQRMAVLDDEFDGRTRLTADPTQISVYCGFLACAGGVGAVATLSSGFFVFFPVKVVDKRDL